MTFEEALSTRGITGAELVKTGFVFGTDKYTLRYTQNDSSQTFSFIGTPETVREKFVEWLDRLDRVS